MGGPEAPDPGNRYFAYGSNLDAEQMEYRGLRVANVRPALLEGYRLGFTFKAEERWRGGAADIIPDSGSAVEGVLYDLDTDIATMDPWEGAPTAYRRIPVVVKVAPSGQRIGCWTYEVVDKLPFQPPSPGYIGKMILHAEKQGLTKGYVRSLRFILACSLTGFSEHAIVLGTLASRGDFVSYRDLAYGLDIDGGRVLKILQDLAEWGWVVCQDVGWAVPETRLQEVEGMVGRR